MTPRAWRRGISPVISTIIIVAVAVSITLAAAIWFGGLSTSFTRIEQAQVTSAFQSATNQVTFVVKNTGDATFTIDNVYVNGVPISSPVTATINATALPTSKTLSPGQFVTVVVSNLGSFAGTTVQVAVHTTSGNLYPASVRLS